MVNHAKPKPNAVSMGSRSVAPSNWEERKPINGLSRAQSSENEADSDGH